MNVPGDNVVTDVIPPGGGESVTAKIGLYVELDLSMYFQEILKTNLLGLFGVAGNT